MKKMKFRLRPHYLIFATLFLLLGISTTMGKYTTVKSVAGKVTFEASLAENVVLQESVVERNADGTYDYKLVDSEHTYTTVGQTYTLIPGVDIPKDPHIVISGKTDIPAYLYIQVVDDLKAFDINGEKKVPITYQVDDEKWVKSSKTFGNGGTVYFYSIDGSNPFEFVTSTVPEDPMYILAPISEGNPNTIKVSQHLKCDDDTRTDAGIITIYAYLVEAASVGTP